MIQAKELRIGNLVALTTEEKTRITQIGVRTPLGQQFFNVDKYGEHPIIDDHIHSITLTPEILNKVGKKDKRDNSWNISHIGFISKNQNGLDDQFSDDMDAYIFNVWYKEGYGTHQAIAELKYVHQLQNLYFTLTGEELEISL